MSRTVVIWALLLLLTLGCNLVEVVPAEEQLKTEIPDNTEGAAPPAEEAPQAPAEPTATPAPPTATPTPTITPTPAPTPTPTPLLGNLTITRPENNPRALYRHGLILAFLLPVLLLGIPWIIAEYFVVRYVQPIGIDVSEVRIKAQDGLFIQAAISITARRSLTLASTRMTWPRVREFVEKTLEQEIIHEALNYATLEDLERNLKNIAERFKELPMVQELSNDFGVEVMRFNIETRYPQETMDALNRKAEASAGGTAYLAYAAAAHLDPDSNECRELYRVYQETRGQVDAARNLGGGLTSLAGVFAGPRQRQEREENHDDDSGH